MTSNGASSNASEVNGIVASFVTICTKAAVWVWPTVAVVLVAMTAYYRSIQPLQYDESYNLQVARSLAEHFSYSTLYAPPQILNPAITTNGPAQYIAALVLLLTHNVILTAIIASALAMLLVALGAYLVRPWLVAVIAILFLRWDVFFYVATNFVGEMWAVGFALLAFVFLRRGLESGTFADKAVRKYILGAIAFFGLAISSKLLIAIAILALLVGVLATDGARKHLAGLPLVQYVIIGTTYIGGSAIAAFVVVMAFSVLHSVRHVSDALALVSLISGFVAHHFLIAHTAHAGGSLPLLSRLHDVNAAVAVLFVAAVGLLTWRNPAYLAIAAVTLLPFIAYNFSERQLAPFIVLTLVFGLEEGRQLCAQIDGRLGLQKGVVALATGFVGVLFVALVCHLANIRFIGTTFEKEARAASTPYAVSTSRGEYYYHAGLISAIKNQKYVVTSGWWQFPEISIRWGLQFYDRINAANSSLTGRRDVALLLDNGNRYWPLTSVDANCGKILYTDGPLVLCRYKPGVSLNYQRKTAQ